MSGEALRQVLDRDSSPLAPSVRLTLIGLAWIIPRGAHSIAADPARIASRILYATGLSRASVYRGLRALVAADLIEVEELRGGRRIRLNVGDWTVSQSETDPRLSLSLSPDLRLAPIYEEIQRAERADDLEVDRLQRADELRASGLSYAEIAQTLAAEALR